MSKILGSITTTPMPRSNWAQTDPTKSDFIYNKPENVSDFINDAEYASIDYVDKAVSENQVNIDKVSDAVADLSGTVSGNYNQSVIALSVDGRTVTYITGDGVTHTFETQDTDTTYSLGTDEVTGLTKLYATTGSAEDGTMTQKAIKTELDKKVGVTVDDVNDILIFTI